VHAGTSVLADGSEVLVGSHGFGYATDPGEARIHLAIITLLSSHPGLGPDRIGLGSAAPSAPPEQVVQPLGDDPAIRLVRAIGIRGFN
jgi:hypothetical protein